MITEEKPGSPGEMLAHFGVLGMKWGITRSKGTKEFKAKFTTPQARAGEIQRARGVVAKQKAQGKIAGELDRATALRMTRGEKYIAGALHALVPLPVVPLAVEAHTLYRVGKRRGIQK